MRFFLLAYCILISMFVFAQETMKPLELTIDYQGRVIVMAKINDQFAARLILDTGADGLLLDEDFFNSTGILINRSQQSLLPGAGSTPKRITVVLDRMKVRVDSMVYYPPYVPLMQLRAIVGENADGIIGPSFLRDYLTEIDFENKKMRLHTDRKFLEGYDSLKLEVRNNRYYLPASVLTNGNLEIKGSFQIDLGSSGAIHMTSPTAKQYSLETGVSNKIKFFNESGGAGGRIEGYEFRAKELKIGKYVLNAPCIDWSTDTSGALARSTYSGLLGNEILERFSTVIDFKNAVLFIKPAKNYGSKFTGPIAGFSYISKINTEKTVIVTGLYEKSPADKAGVKPGDRIIFIDGKSVLNMTEKDLKTILGDEGNDIELTLKRENEQLKIKLPRKELL
ncbi:MAG: aspartyl protease family protein [Bacteroidia bacterium]|nr:aspartyl protease family protein [Bacteroidia bacterium]